MLRTEPLWRQQEATETNSGLILVSVAGFQFQPIDTDT